MRLAHIDDKYLKAEIYLELINDMQARIMEFEKETPNYMTAEIKEANRQLSDARTKARIYIDEEHFLKWETLLDHTDALMLRTRLFC